MKGNVVIIIIGLLVSSCTPNPIKITVKLPDGFRGVFYIQRQPNADNVTKTSDGYVLAVPPTGILAIGGKDPFEEWHNLRVYDSKGEEIPVASGGEYPNDKQLRVWHISVDHNGKHKFFIGTPTEARSVEQGGNEPVGTLPTGTKN
jgi:hypothetical protein